MLLRLHKPAGLPQLEQLSINACPQLQRVELNAFSGLYGLMSLELSHNKQLVSIDSAAFERPNQLRRVILRANALSTLPHPLLNWAQLDQLDLDVRLLVPFHSHHLHSPGQSMALRLHNDMAAQRGSHVAAYKGFLCSA